MNDYGLNLKSILNWILISVMIIGCGIFIAYQLSDHPDRYSTFDETITQLVGDIEPITEKDFELIEEAITEFLDEKGVVPAKQFEMDPIANVVIVITIAISCGIWGGIAAYSMSYIETFWQGSLTSNSEKKQARNYLDPFNRIQVFNKSSIHASVFCGIVASSMVPLFLRVIGSSYVNESIGDPNAYLILIGFCLLAAVFSHNFITKLAEQTINKRFKEMVEEVAKGNAEFQSSLHKVQVDNEYNKKLQDAISTFMDYKNKLVDMTNTQGSRDKYTPNISGVDSVNRIGTAKTKQLVSLLDLSLERIDEALCVKNTSDAALRKCNILRQKYSLTKEVDSLEKAVIICEGILNKDSDYDVAPKDIPYAAYNGACYNLLLKNNSKAKKFFEIALSEANWTGQYFLNDPDTKSFRNQEEGKALIKKYRLNTSNIKGSDTKECNETLDSEVEESDSDHKDSDKDLNLTHENTDVPKEDLDEEIIEDKEPEGGEFDQRPEDNSNFDKPNDDNKSIK